MGPTIERRYSSQTERWGVALLRTQMRKRVRSWHLIGILLAILFPGGWACTAGNLDAGISELGKGRLENAEIQLQQELAERQRSFGPSSSATGVALADLGVLYFHQGRCAEAAGVLERAKDIFEKDFSRHIEQMNGVLSALAYTYSCLGRHSDAVRVLLRELAENKAVGNPYPSYVYLALGHLGNLYYSIGSYDEALATHTKAMGFGLKSWGSEFDSKSWVLSSLAADHIGLAQYAEAENLYRGIPLYYLDSSDPDSFKWGSLLFYSILHADEAVLYQHKHDTARSLAHIRESVRLARKAADLAFRDRTISTATDRAQLASVFNRFLRVTADAVEQQPGERRHLIEESFEIGQLAHEGVVEQALLQSVARLSLGNGEVASLVREQQDAYRSLKQVTEKLASAAANSVSETNSTAESGLRRQMLILEGKIKALNNRLIREFPAYAGLITPRSTNLTTIKSLLRSGEALVVYAVPDDSAYNNRDLGSYVWLVEHGKETTFRRIPYGRHALERRVKILREALSPESNPLELPFPTIESYNLYRNLLGPEADLLKGVSTLFVVADGPLESLPFSVLVTRPPHGRPDDYQNIEWLSRRIATDTLPTVSSFHALRTEAPATAPALPFIGFGDPELGGTRQATQPRVASIALTRGPIADPNSIRALLPPLPETAAELKAIASSLGVRSSAVHLGSEATVTAVRESNLSSYRVIAFATHALLASETKMLYADHGTAEPALVLTPPAKATKDDDGLLRASEIASLKLNADWVVLSACDTAAPDGTPGTFGLSGLAKAFFYAGARALLISQWAVRSEPTVTLTTGLFRELAAHPKIGRAEALRRSMMAMLAHPARPEYTHPQAWAPFIVAGEGGAGER